MFTTIALLCLLLALLAVRRYPGPLPAEPRHVSFSLVPRWSSPFHKRKSSAPDSSPAPADPFGRILPPSPDVYPSTKSARRLSAPLRLSFTSKRRSTLIHLDRLDTRAPPPPSSTSAPPQRIRFVIPFSKHFRSRTPSPPNTFKDPNIPSSNSSGMSPPARPRALINKFKSIFKSIPPESSPIIHSKSFLTAINTRLRRKPVARTEPYGPPWNVRMPVPDFTPSQHPLQKPTQTMSPSPQSSRKRSVHESRSEKTPMSFISELDEKLLLLQQQRIQDLMPSPHR